MSKEHLNEELETRNNIKNSNVTIPEKLSPEHMEQFLLEMEQSGEIDKRRKKAKSKDWKKYSLIAAGILLLVGGTTVMQQQWSRKSETSNESKTAASMNVASENYEKAYDIYVAYKKQMSEMRISSNIDIAEDSMDKEISAADNVLESQDSSDSMKSSSSSSSLNSYVINEEQADYSSTNVRTQGVDESDIVKTDGEYIYEYDENTEKINIYKATKKKTKKLASINMNPYGIVIGEQGFFVNQNKLVVVGDDMNSFGATTDVVKESLSSDSEETPTVRVLIFDISNRQKPTFVHGFFQDGYMNHTRLCDGILYTISKVRMPYENCKKEHPETYVPKIDGKVIAAKDLYIQEDYEDISYSVLTSISLTDVAYVNQKAILGGASQLYMGNDNIYLIDYQYSMEGSSQEKSQIMKLSYQDGVIQKVATGIVPGTLLDDYSLDEQNGYLRLVTTYYKQYEEYNGLFILDKNLKQVGCLKNLAKGEQIYSSRFLGNTAYFVTYRNRDPLFAVDISDPESPTMLSYLKIPGFSDYLHPYGNGLLLGVGEETDEDGTFIGIKLSMFDISNPEDVKEIDKEVLTEYTSSFASYNPNALLIDADKNMIGMQMDGYDSSNECEISDYVVYSYDKKNGFQQKLKCHLNQNPDKEEEDANYVYVNSRGLYIGDELYVVNVGHWIDMYSLKDYKRINEK